jgi:hypothetical protein
MDEKVSPKFPKLRTSNDSSPRHNEEEMSDLGGV